MKNVLVLTGAGQIGLAIVRSIGSGMKIVVSDKSAANAASAALLLNNAGFDAVEHSCDISSKESVAELIKFSKELDRLQLLLMPPAYLRVKHPSKPFSRSTFTAQLC